MKKRWRRRCSHGAGPGTVMRGRRLVGGRLTIPNLRPNPAPIPDPNPNPNPNPKPNPDPNLNPNQEPSATTASALWSRVRSCARNGLRFAQVYSGAYLRSLRERRVLWLTFCGRGGGGVGAGHVHSGVGMNRVEGSLGARPCQHETGCVREPWCGSVRGGARRVAAAGRHDLRAQPRTSTGKRAGMSASVWG